MRKHRPGPAPRVDVVTDGSFLGIEEYVQRKIGALLRLAHEPVLSARVRLTRSPGLGARHPVTARATVDVNGRPVHAGVTATTARESVDRLEATLRTALERHARHWEARRGRTAHRTAERRPAGRVAATPAPPEEPVLVSAESHAHLAMTAEDAATELDRLGGEFLLFTLPGTGRDAVLYRAGHTGYRLALVEPDPAWRPAAAGSRFTVSARRAPLLTAREAVDRLEMTGLPFVFFLDADRGRGCVVHRRRDGRYGLVVPPMP